MALEHNECGHFINFWSDLKVVDSPCVWTKNIKKIKLPIRHGEGRFVFSKNLGNIEEQLNQFVKSNRVVLRYESNPNGSISDIAGVCDDSGLVFGLMPHPEAATSLLHYPGHEMDAGESLGQEIFNNIGKYLKENFS